MRHAAPCSQPVRAHLAVNLTAGSLTCTFGQTLPATVVDLQHAVARKVSVMGSYRRQVVLASDGGSLGLDWWAGSYRPEFGQPDTPVVMFVHGINGGAARSMHVAACCMQQTRRPHRSVPTIHQRCPQAGAAPHTRPRPGDACIRRSAPLMTRCRRQPRRLRQMGLRIRSSAWLAGGRLELARLQRPATDQRARLQCHPDERHSCGCGIHQGVGPTPWNSAPFCCVVCARHSACQHPGSCVIGMLAPRRTGVGCGQLCMLSADSGHQHAMANIRGRRGGVGVVMRQSHHAWACAAGAFPPRHCWPLATAWAACC